MVRVEKETEEHRESKYQERRSPAVEMERLELWSLMALLMFYLQNLRYRDLFMIEGKQ